jgi:hypothetical protein
MVAMITDNEIILLKTQFLSNKNQLKRIPIPIKKDIASV